MLRYSGKEESPVIVPKNTMQEVLRWVHGSRLSGGYGLRRSVAKSLPGYYWKGFSMRVAKLVDSCLYCTLSQDRQPSRQAEFEIVYPTKRFQQMAFYVQTIALRTARGNLKVFDLLDVFRCYDRAKAIPDESAKTIPRTLRKKLVSLLRPMELFLSGGDLYSVRGVAENL